MQGTNEFGGQWTQEKLMILEKYLDAYTTVLKNKRFNLVYIDAFAGTGQVIIKGNDTDEDKFINGSAQIAINIENRPFDEYIFVEKYFERCQKLEILTRKNPNKRIQIKNEDANLFLQNLELNWSENRGVLFFDPFATEVEWKTIKKIASFKALDTWILFPTSAIARMLPRNREPNEISPQLANSLTRIYGDESWNNLYQPSKQISLFNFEQKVRKEGTDGLIDIYKSKLSKLFKDRFLEESRTLKNSKGGPLFEFMFCAGNFKGIPIAKKIAKHIIKRI